MPSAGGPASLLYETSPAYAACLASGGREGLASVSALLAAEAAAGFAWPAPQPREAIAALPRYKGVVWSAGLGAGRPCWLARTVIVGCGGEVTVPCRTRETVRAGEAMAAAHAPRCAPPLLTRFPPHAPARRRSHPSFRRLRACTTRWRSTGAGLRPRPT